MYSTKLLCQITLILLFLHTGCLSPIELDVPSGLDDSIVINAKIVKGNPSIFTLQLSQLFSFTSSSRGRIIGKNVILINNLGNELEIEPTGEGVYYYEFLDDDPFKIQIGSSYRMSIEMFDGRIFESTSEPLLSVPKIDKVNYKIIEKTLNLPNELPRISQFIQYEVTSKLSDPSNGQKSQLRWELEKVFRVTDSPINGSEPKVCYVSNREGVFDIIIYDGLGTNVSQLDDHIIYEDILDTSYGEGQYFTVIQESLSPSAFQYWEKVKNISARKDDLYADPPGKIESNFTHVNGNEEAFGFFYLSAQDTIRTYLDPALLGFPATRCPSPDLINFAGECGDPLCCDCLAQDNSTSQKPDFWIN